MANDEGKIRVTAKVNLTLGDPNDGFHLQAQLQAFGGPMSFSIASRDSFSFKQMWDLAGSALDDTFDVSLPTIPEGPWDVFTNAQLYPSFWFEPGGDKPNMQFMLTFKNEIKVGGPSKIGPVDILIEPSFTVKALMVGYSPQGGLGVSASVEIPTTTKDGAGGTVTKVVDYPFPVPAQKSSPTLKVHYLGLGQRIGPKPVLNTNSESPLTEIFDKIEKTFTVNDPKSVLTDLAENYYDTSLGWFIAADIEIKAFRIKVLFNDPAMYGLEITVADDPPTFLSGLRFEILYQRIGPNLGVYYAAVELPTAMRRIPMAGFVLVLPGFALWIYTNGDFRINVGWPVGQNSIGISWQILTGWVGFYFAKLRSGNNPGANPTVQFNPILALGIGFRLEAGISIDAGVFSASLSISVTVTMQGLLAWREGHSVASAPEAYWFAGTFEVQVLIKGAVDFKVIKASVTISFSFKAEIALENGYGTELLINAQVTARASVKIVFFTVHFSFHTSITHKVTLTSGAAGIASVKGPQQAGLNGLLSAAENRVLEQVARSGAKAQPALRTELPPLFPPPRLAPEIRSMDASMLARTTVSDRVTVHAKFALQGTALYGATPADDTFGAVGLLLLGGRDPGSTAQAETRTDFEDMVARMVCWLLGDQDETFTVDDRLSDRLRALLSTLKSTDAMDFAVTIKQFFIDKVTFSITGVDGAVMPSEEDVTKSWTALPMFDVLTLTTNGIPRDFNSYQPIPDNYEKAVDLYFEGLSLFGDQADDGFAARAVQPEAVKTMAGFLLADYYLMLAQHAITDLHDAALAYEKKTAPQPPEESDIQVPDPEQVELDALLEAFDYASCAGFVSRALLGGQQLPDPAQVPDTVTPENIHNVPTGAIFALSGQQSAVVATGAAQTVTATLTISEGVNAPAWLELIGGVDAAPLTATLPLPESVPAKPVPDWTGTGLVTIPDGLLPAGDAGAIAYSQLSPLAEVAMRLTTRNQTVWTAKGGTPKAIVQLPTPLLALANTQEALSATLEIAQDPGSATPAVAAPGMGGLMFDFPVAQVNTGQPSASDDMAESGVAPNLYQIWATDDVSRKRIQQVIEAQLSVKITLLYVDADGEGVQSDDLDAGVLLSRANLSTENQAKAVSKMLIARSGAEGSDPSFALLAEDPLGFLRLIWEVSVVNATGFYLFYRTKNGDGLPSRLFAQSGTTQDSPGPAPIDGTNGQTASLRVLVEFQSTATASVPLPAPSNCIISEALVEKPAAMNLFAAGTALNSWHSRLSAGELGFELEWDGQNAAEPVIGQINPAALYQLIQFNVQGQSGKAGEIWSLPLSPVQDTSADDPDTTPDLAAPAGTQLYRQAFEAYRFLNEALVAADAENVYALAGAEVGLQYRLTDIFGNALPAQARATETGVYHDPLFNVTQWPMVQASHYFTTPIDGSTDHALMVLCMAFDTKGLDALVDTALEQAALSGGDSSVQLVSLARKYALILDQLTDPGTTHLLSSSLLDDADGMDVAPQLIDFARKILDLINAHLSGAVPVNARQEVDPLGISLQTRVPFSTVAGLPDNILPVTVGITARRHANLAPDLEERLPEAVVSTADIVPRRGESFPDMTKPRTDGMLCPPTSDEQKGTSSLIVYARNFESGFKGFNGQGGMLKLAERAGLVADTDSDEVQTLWAVRFADSSEKDAPPAAGIRAEFDPEQITYFALPPLNIEPISRAVDHVTYNAIDMDQWSRQTFSAIDSLFEPALNVAIAQLAAFSPLVPDVEGAGEHVPSDVLSSAKRVISKAMSQTLEPILVDAPVGEQSRAAEQLEQAMLTRLSAAYAVSTVLQVPAVVSVRNSAGALDSGAQRPPELFGRVGPPLTDGKSGATAKVYDLSGGRLDVSNGTQWATVMVSVTDQGAQRSLELPLEYSISALQHDFESGDAFEGYMPSAWLSFVLPGDVLNIAITGQMPVSIPIPLPFEPSAPSLTTQAAAGTDMSWKPGDGLSALIEDALKWRYQVGMQAPIVAQDQLYLDAIFGTGQVAPHVNGAGNVNPVNLPLFDAMARFLAGWAEFAKNIPSILAAASTNPPDEAAQKAAGAQISQITTLIRDIAVAWNTRVIETRSVEAEPEVIHYRLRIERDKDTPDDLRMTFAGWTLVTGEVVKPGRWPVISFVPQSGGNSLDSWKVDGDTAQRIDENGQPWWVVSQTVPAHVFPEYFLFDWDGLDLSKRQLGRVQTWVRRNAELVADHETSAAFVYETDAVSFASPGIPLIDRSNLPDVPVDPDSTLVSVLTSLLEPLDFGDPAQEPFIRFHAELRYDLSTPPGGSGKPLQATYPLLLLPNLVLGDDVSENNTVTPQIAAQQIAAALAVRYAMFAGRDMQVYLVLSLTLFGSEQGQQVPLINIAGLPLDVTKVPMTWWTAQS
ncbi:hypothetical protein P775_00940 [Puniceibacterium antarcticum]|uniref:LysM domain-containing protein n=1 Tax=Puniceibacterium antarcticum TaxID=1206336 RepID=A0A2G8RKN1_9RHOB|nr:hypothetical protein [Puniceibacterium antarcticum]PIL22062.1 hypothetical protein P775_00940 [Puniceibacterium antarcticum]